MSAGKRRASLWAIGLVAAAAAWAHQPSVAQGLSLSIRDGHVTLGIGFGMDVPALPRLVRVPGLPAYYAPDLSANYFFHDGLYWVYADDNWYASTWFNGPWELIERDRVPLFVLRIPLRYYRTPPGYFYGLPLERPPRWGEFWGQEWEQRHRSWNVWDPRQAPPPAPLPRYQGEFGEDRYPRLPQEQRELHQRYYPSVPRDGSLTEHLGKPVPPRPQGRAPSPKPGAEPGGRPREERPREVRPREDKWK